MKQNHEIWFISHEETCENNKNAVYYLNKGWVPQTGPQYDYCTIEPLQGALEHHTFFHPIFTGLESIWHSLFDTVKHHIITFIKLLLNCACALISLTKTLFLSFSEDVFPPVFLSSFIISRFVRCTEDCWKNISLIQHRIKQGRRVIMAHSSVV